MAFHIYRLEEQIDMLAGAGTGNGMKDDVKSLARELERTVERRQVDAS
jgi:hypothetical protein